MAGFLMGYGSNYECIPIMKVVVNEDPSDPMVAGEWNRLFCLFLIIG